MSLLMSPSSSSSSSSSSSYHHILDSTKHALSKTSKLLDKTMHLLKQNKYVFAFVLVCLLMYAPSAAPKLSKSLEGLLKNYFVKFVYIFVLAYLLTNSVNVAVVVALVITVGALILKKLESENFTSHGLSTQADTHVQKVEEVINKLSPRTIECTEASCGDAKRVSSPSCSPQLDAQNKVTGFICNDTPNLEPVTNEPPMDGYVEAARHNIDSNFNISDVGLPAANEYTNDNLGDEYEPVN